MAKDILDRLKIISEIVKNYKWLFLALLSLSVTNAGQYAYNKSVANHLNKTEEHISQVISNAVVKEVDYSKVKEMINHYNASHVKRYH